MRKITSCCPISVHRASIKQRLQTVSSHSLYLCLSRYFSFLLYLSRPFRTSSSSCTFLGTSQPEESLIQCMPAQIYFRSSICTATNTSCAHVCGDNVMSPVFPKAPVNKCMEVVILLWVNGVFNFLYVRMVALLWLCISSRLGCLAFTSVLAVICSVKAVYIHTVTRRIPF